MTKLNEIYLCKVCGNITLVLDPHEGELVCCGQPMEKQEAKNQEQGFEKHLPVVEEVAEGLKIKVGSVPHPMEEEHYIKFIGAIDQNNGIRIKYLKPGEEPLVIFCQDKNKIKSAFAYCNVHGLWQK